MPAETSPSWIQSDACQACGHPVILARMKVGAAIKLVPVEICATGRGNLGLAVSLFAVPAEMPTAELVTTGTKYRSHREHCPGAKRGRAVLGAFSAGAALRKERPR